MNEAHFVIEHKGLIKKWHWKFVAANGRVMATGNQDGYKSKRTCHGAMKTLTRELYPDRPVPVYEVLQTGRRKKLKCKC